MGLIDWDNKHWKEKENGDFKFDLKNITAKTFDVTARKWSLVIANVDNGTKKNQVRNFYDKVLELYQKVINTDENEFITKILPFIKMLNSKVVYASNKDSGKANKAFVIFMQEALKQIDNRESFINFKYLFEAIIGFYQEEKIIKQGKDTNCNKSIFYIKQNYEKKCHKPQNNNKNNYKGRR